MKADVIKWGLYSGRGAVKSKNAFIGFMELLHENGHELLSDYVNDKTKVLINFGCEHEPHWISPASYKRGVKCPKCSGRCPKQAEEEFIALLTKNNHELLSEYVNDKTKVLINFGCEHEPHWVSPNSYKAGNRCPKCSGKCPKQAEEEFLNLLRRNNHELLSEYVNNKTKVLINFGCEHEPHWVKPNHYKAGNRCPKCSGRCPKQAEEEFLNLLRRNNHELLSEYIKGKTKVLINFNCGHDPHWVRPDSYKKGIGCPKCSGLCPKQAEEEFIALLTKNNHELLSEYVNATTKVLINFNCGHDPHWVRPASYKRGVKCPKCSGLCPKQAEEEFIALLTKNNHELLSKYINNTTKVLINFNCGHDPHWVIPNSYKSGNRCPKCKFSKGEKVILDYLTENEFNVVSQHKIDGYNYKYDIYIREYNLIVEVHGRQHYEEVDFFGTRTLEEERMNDYEKEKLAVSKGYNYMVVDYKEHKPELALERFKEQFRFYETKQPKLEVFL